MCQQEEYENFSLPSLLIVPSITAMNEGELRVNILQTNWDFTTYSKCSFGCPHNHSLTPWMYKVWTILTIILQI